MAFTEFSSIFSNLDSSLTLDIDRNRIVDSNEETAYQIYSNGERITISNRRGRIFNDASNGNWDVIAAAEANNGFAVLRAGTSRRRLGQYRLWFTNNDGGITSSTRWESGESLKQQGYESTFNIDLDGDGQIGNNVRPPTVNDGQASILIRGMLEPEGTLSVQLAEDDPDGNGDLESQILQPLWERSSDGGQTWSSLGSSETLTIDSALQGSLIRASISYVDGDEFVEAVVSQSVSIPDPPPETVDDYGNTPNSSGFLEIGSTATGILEKLGDRDWFRVSLETGSAYNFAASGQGLNDTYLRLYGSDGQLLAENDDYEGYNSAINNYQIAETGDYYLGVGAYADNGTGTYFVSANRLPANSPGYSSQDGYGQINIQMAFEQHLSISLAPVAELGGRQWTLDNINAPEVWVQSGEFLGATGFGTVVAVIDTGVDLDHEEFAGRIVQGYDFVDNDLEADDGNGHGTHVAGTIAGANDGNEVTGVAFSAQIMPIRVLNNSGSGYTSDIVSGIRYAAENNADVINLSLGGGGYSQSMADAIEYASNLGSVVVMAAGNSGGSSPEYPAAHARYNGLAVGAVDQAGNMASFSNLSGDIEIDYVSAPGVDVYSSIPGDRYASYNGTSMATPHVAGAAALLRGYDPSLSAESIEDLLTGTASNSFASSSFTAQDFLEAGEYDSLTN